MELLMPIEQIITKIFYINNHKVIIDKDLAELYHVETKVLNQAVKRNIERFPEDFMFQLNDSQKNKLVTNCDRFKSLKHSTSNPYAFTEQGVAMLSSVLRSKHAIEVNIFIMRAFVKMRSMHLINEKIFQEISVIKEELKLQSRKMDSYDEEIEIIIQTIEKMLTAEPVDSKKIGFE